ncbi:MAG: hypothetical protein HYT11_01475, partial [Candidatus Levybacteria bacterium]|nr:hypothetical protein [Candidatus Levybacteria bacterium]
TKTPTPVKSTITTKKLSSSIASNSPTINKEQKNYPTAVLGEKIEVSPTKIEVSDQNLIQSSAFTTVPFIGGGALFLTACGILAFRAYRKRKYEQTDSSDE